MKRYILIICAVTIALASCTKNFEEMNKDPFSPTGTTVEALFNGVVSSLQQSMNEQFYLQNEIWYPETELGKKAAVVATGGLAGRVTPFCKREILCEPDLLLKGLAALWEKNRKDRR